MLTPLRAIRKHCLECSGNAKEVKLCVVKECNLFKYRLGKRHIQKDPKSGKLDNREIIKKKAQQQLNFAIKKGILQRARKCVLCGSTENIHGHHEDYSKPLDVKWLCHVCHFNHHHLSKVNSGVGRVVAYGG